MTMRTIKSLALLALFLSPTLASAETFPRNYTPAQLSTIMSMRDNGDGLADVAKVVGGSRADVKAAERVEKARRKAVEHVHGTVWLAVASN
jgi:hypothetical protein